MSDRDVVRHRDETVSIRIEDLRKTDTTPVHLHALTWFMSLTPENRATVIIRAYQDIPCDDIGDRDES